MGLNIVDINVFFIQGLQTFFLFFWSRFLRFFNILYIFERFFYIYDSSGARTAAYRSARGVPTWLTDDDAELQGR